MISIEEYHERKSAFFAMLDRSNKLIEESRNIPDEPVEFCVQRSCELLKQIDDLQDEMDKEHIILSAAKAFYND